MNWKNGKFSKPFKLLFVQGTSNACKEDIECPANSYCELNVNPSISGLCVCNEGFILITEDKVKKCFSISEYGDVCYKREQCEVKLGNEATCLNGFCQCKSGSHYVHKTHTCYKTSSKHLPPFRMSSKYLNF